MGKGGGGGTQSGAVLVADESFGPEIVVSFGGPALMRIFFQSDTRFEATYTKASDNSAIISGTLTANLTNAITGAALGGSVSGAHIASGLWSFTIPDNQAGLALGMLVKIVVTLSSGGLDLRKAYLAQVVEFDVV